MTLGEVLMGEAGGKGGGGEKTGSQASRELLWLGVERTCGLSRQ